MSETQIVALDLGRGYVKASLEGMEGVKELKFRAMLKEGYEVDMNADETRNHFSVQGLSAEADHEWFVGEYAAEQQAPGGYTTDSKIDASAQVLFMGALNALLDKGSDIKVMLGVPKSMYNKKVLQEVQEMYLDKEILIHDKVLDKHKVVRVTGINIFTEANAAAMYLVKSNPDLEQQEFGIVNCGFRTTELAYYKPDLRYIEGLSGSIEYGNMDILENVKKKTKTKKDIQAIDLSTHFELELAQAYKTGQNKLKTEVERTWRSQLADMRIYVCGGTAEHLSLPYERIDAGQFTTVRGLMVVAKAIFGQ